MKVLGSLLLVLALATVMFAQSEAHQHPTTAAKPDAPKSESQKSFDTLKTLAGEWEGPITVDPPQPQWQDGSKGGLHISLRVTSRGHAIVHELQQADTPLDFTKYDHPVTMLYLDENDRLSLIHYCDAGNRPHMLGKASPDGKKIEFDFTDLTGSNKFGHMHQGVFIPVDENHHIEEWTWMAPNNKPIHVRFDLHRVPAAVASAKQQ